MLFDRAPSYRRGMDLWSPSSGSVSPVASLSPTLAFGNAALFEGVAPEVKRSDSSQSSVADAFGLASPGATWGSLFGMKGFSELSNFPSLTVHDKASPSALSTSSSVGPIIPDLDSELKLPAWCSDVSTALTPESDGFGDMLNLDAEPAQPTRRLRRTGKLNAKPKISRISVEPNSPDLGGATKSFIVDPFLDPTPANRPLRQYVSAPVLSPEMNVAAPAFSSAGMVGSASMDDILSDFGWGDLGSGSRHNSTTTALAVDSPAGGAAVGPSSHRGSTAAQQAHADSLFGEQTMAGQSGSSANLHAMSSLATMSQQHSSDNNVGADIDGSLWKRRAAQKEDGDMPNPTVIETATPQHGHQGPRSVPAASLTFAQQIALGNKTAAPHFTQGLGVSTDLQTLQMMQLQMSLGNVGGLGQLPAFVAPMAGAPIELQAPRAVQPAMLMGSDSLTRSNSFDSRLSVPVIAAVPAPIAVAASGPIGFAMQPGSEQLLFMSGAAAQAATMGPPHVGAQASQMSAHLSSPVPKVSSSPTSTPSRRLTGGRSRKHSLAQPPVNALDLHGIPASARSQSTVTMGNLPAAIPYAAHQVPLLATWAGPTPWLQPQTPSTGSSVNSSLPSSGLSSFGQPSSADSLSSAELPPRTPPMLKSKKNQSSPNLRGEANNMLGSPNSSPSGRKIASNRRVQSAKDLRGRSNSLKNASPTPNSPTKPSLTAGGFSFVNYGIEDAQELCSAVAPSGSYKIPLKGFGGSPILVDGMPLPSSSYITPSPKKPSTSVSPTSKSKPRIRAPVDNSRWIIETGEDSCDEDSDEEDEDDGAKASKRSIKKRKSEEKLPVMRKSASSPRLRK